MRTMFKAAAALALAAAAVTTLGVTGASADDTPWAGCPSGAVCIYAQNVKDGISTPTDVFWSYGAHNLSNQVGMHWVLNNQTGGAHAHLCRGYDGTDCTKDILQDTGVYTDLTPIDSVTLDRP